MRIIKLVSADTVDAAIAAIAQRKVMMMLTLLLPVLLLIARPSTAQVLLADQTLQEGKEAEDDSSKAVKQAEKGYIRMMLEGLLT